MLSSSTKSTENTRGIGPGPTTSTARTDKLPQNVEFVLWVLIGNLYLYRNGLLPLAWQDLPYLPFLGALDYLPTELFSLLLTPILFISPVAIILRYRPTLFSALLGAAVFLSVLACRPIYSTNLLFHGCLFFLIGCYPYTAAQKPNQPNTSIFRWQLALIYFGAGLNKALLIDWWDGDYMVHFATEFSNPRTWLLHAVPNQEWLAKSLGWATIVIELITLPCLLLRQKTVRYAILLGLSFHLGMLFLTAGQLSVIYLYLASAAYLLLWSFPDTSRSSHLILRYRFQLLLTTYFGGILLWLIRGRVFSFLDKLF